MQVKTEVFHDFINPTPSYINPMGCITPEIENSPIFPLDDTWRELSDFKSPYMTCKLTLYENSLLLKKQVSDSVPSLDTFCEEFEYHRQIVRIIPNVGKYKDQEILMFYDFDLLYTSLPGNLIPLNPFLSTNYLDECVKLLLHEGDVKDDLFCNSMVQSLTKDETVDLWQRRINLRIFDSKITSLCIAIPRDAKFFELAYLLKQSFGEFEIYHFNGKYVEETKFLTDSFDLHMKGEDSIIISISNEKVLERVDKSMTLCDFDVLLRKRFKIPDSSFLWISQVKGLRPFVSFDSFRKGKMEEVKDGRNVTCWNAPEIYSKIECYKMTLSEVIVGRVVDVFELKGPCREIVPIGMVDVNPDWNERDLKKFVHHLQGKTLNVI